MHRYYNPLWALLAGACLPLAFAPFHFYPAAYLSVAILFWLWRHASAWHSWTIGFWYGIGCFGVGVSWVYVSLHAFGGMHPLGALLLTVLFVAAMAVYPACLGWLINRFFARYSMVKLLLVMPAGWTLIEWVRGWFLTGFPWLYLGYSQIDSPLKAIAPITGVLGISFAVALIASLLVYALPSFRRLFIALALLLSLWVGSYQLLKLDWTQPTGESLQVALIQANTPAEYLERFEIPYGSILRYLTRSSLAKDADLVIWPETAIPIFYHQAAEYLAMLHQIHQENGTEFIIGIPYMNLDNFQYYNSVITLGAESGRYSKHHLVPFGEFVPLYSWFGSVFNFIDVPVSEFSRGPFQQPPLQSVGQPIGISICYEDAFGEQMRTHLPTATLLVNISNDSWFGDSLAPHQHLQIAQMRALESGRYLLRATNTGISAIIDHEGQILMRSPRLKLDTLRGMAQPYQGITPYVRYGDKLIVSLMLILLIGAAMLHHFPRRVAYNHDA